MFNIPGWVSEGGRGGRRMLEEEENARRREEVEFLSWLSASTVWSSQWHVSFFLSSFHLLPTSNPLLASFLHWRNRRKENMRKQVWIRKKKKDEESASVFFEDSCYLQPLNKNSNYFSCYGNNKTKPANSKQSNLSHLLVFLNHPPYLTHSSSFQSLLITVPHLFFYEIILVLRVRLKLEREREREREGMRESRERWNEDSNVSVCFVTWLICPCMSLCSTVS